MIASWPDSASSIESGAFWRIPVDGCEPEQRLDSALPKPLVGGSKSLFTKVSCTFCQTARRFKGLARRSLRTCVSGCALARGFLVSAPPVSASWKPFPAAESRDRFATVGDRFANSARVRVRAESECPRPSWQLAKG